MELHIIPSFKTLGIPFVMMMIMNVLLNEIALSDDSRVEEKKEEKMIKHQYLMREGQLKVPVKVILVVNSWALGTIPKKFELYVEKGEMRFQGV